MLEVAAAVGEPFASPVRLVEVRSAEVQWGRVEGGGLAEGRTDVPDLCVCVCVFASVCV